MTNRIHKSSRRRAGPMGVRPWLSIRVELVEGRGERYWPRPGRLFAAAISHSYAQLATAIDDADVLDESRERLSNLQASQQFIYVFDLGDDWTHLCTVVEAGIDPHDVLGVVPNAPLPYFGWGNIPDQYGRAWAKEDDEAPTRLDPELTDLPPLRPGWGPKR